RRARRRIVNHRVGGKAEGRRSFWAEVPDALVGEWNCRHARDALLDPGTLVVEKAEQSVLEDRTAEVSAELVLIVLRLGEIVGIGDEVGGIEVLVSQVFICHTVEGVGATLGVDRNSSAGTSAIFGRIRVRYYIEFLNRVD